MAIVRFESLLVVNSGAVLNFVDEDWNVVLEVNGQAANVGNPLGTQDDRSFSFGSAAEVSVPLSVDSVIRVSCGGEFNPNSLIQGPLPSRARSHGSAENWGLGGSFTLEASNRDRAYEVHYSIDCLTQDVPSLVLRRDLLNLVNRSLAGMRQKMKLPEEVALSLMLGKLGRHGYKLKAAQGEELVFEGPGDIHGFLRRLIKEPARTTPKKGRS